MNVLNIVAHNIPSLNANRQLGIVDKERARSSEKLASGYKINRSADDAAGLSISEKMRKRIRGLNQGSENLQDGVSLCQTADGALMEVEDMIHRMNELAIKAANGTNSQSDRQDINDEITQLKDEMTRVFNTTKFNEIYIFKAPYVPDVVGQPTDYEMFNGPDGATPAGVMINNKRYTFGELEVPEKATTDWIKEITDPDKPEELIRLCMKAGESPEDLHRVYVMTADDTGILINNLYAGLWDSTITQEGSTFSFSYRGMDITIEAESTDRNDVIDRLRKDPNTEISWDAAPVAGRSNNAVSSSVDSMRFNVTNGNMYDIEDWKYSIQADENGVGLVQTNGNDGLTHTKTAWEDFSNIEGGESFPISDWGSADEGNNPVTLDSSAKYGYRDGARAGYYTNYMEFDFSFPENEVSKQQAINGFQQDVIGYNVSSPISGVTSNPGATVRQYPGFDDFHFQRDKLLRNFGDNGSSDTMEVTVTRTLENRGTVTDHEWRRELSEAYAKKMDHYVDTRTVTYTGIASVTYYGPDGTTELTEAPEGGSYDDTVPAGTSVDYNNGDATSFLKNTGLSATWTGTSEDVLSSTGGTETIRREIKDDGGMLLGYAVITFNKTTEEKRTTNSRYEANGGEIINYVKNDDNTYSSPEENTAYIRASGDDLPKDTQGNSYRTANSSDAGQRYVMTKDAWIGIRDYELDRYTYSASNSGGTQIMSSTGGQFLKTDGSATSITIHTNTGAIARYDTENTASVLRTTLSDGSGHSLVMDYASGVESRSNTVTVTPNGPATRAFTKSYKGAGRATDTDLIVRVNPPEKKLELQAADVNLENEREILKWTPLSNSILGLSNANTVTETAARTTISCIEGALQILNYDRSVFGAYQNRLEHAIKINDNTSENTQAAESIIRDTDMAAEMVKFSKEGILQQAGQAMLSQANQANKGVLSLLQ